jgi:hypothetical protein
MMPLFSLGKKKEAPGAPSPMAGPPSQPSQQDNLAQLVISMRQQGLDNNQIVQYLQRSGYNSNQIFDALSQADLRSAAPDQFNPDDSAPFPGSNLQPMRQGMPQMQQPQMAPPQMSPPPMQQSMPPPPMPSHDLPDNHEQIEELVETVIDEKWEEFSKNINKIIEWKNSTEAKIASIEQQFKDLKELFDKLHTAIIGKITEYDQNIRNVDTDIKAMEKVFQKILPTFTDNVSELSRITKNLKKP